LRQKNARKRTLEQMNGGNVATTHGNINTMQAHVQHGVNDTTHSQTHLAITDANDATPKSTPKMSILRIPPIP